MAIFAGYVFSKYHIFFFSHYSNVHFLHRCIFVSLLSAFILRTRLTLINKRNKAKLAALSEDEKHQLRDDVEIWDNDPRYVFVT
jgi:hypothetical protein